MTLALRIPFLRRRRGQDRKRRPVGRHTAEYVTRPRVQAGVAKMRAEFEAKYPLYTQHLRRIQRSMADTAWDIPPIPDRAAGF